MKNKEITIYELMGLIKDRKAPIEIKYDGKIYRYNNGDYIDEYFNSLFDKILKKYDMYTILTEQEVEILPEENDEWEEMKEMDIGWLSETKPDNTLFLHLINLLIKNQKYLKAMVESLQRSFTDEIRVDIPKWIVDPKKEKLESKDEK